MAREVKQKLLARADRDDPDWQVKMEIRLYRERPSAQRPGKPVVERLWNFLLRQSQEAATVRGRKRVKSRRKPLQET